MGGSNAGECSAATVGMDADDAVDLLHRLDGLYVLRLISAAGQCGCMTIFSGI